MAPAEYEDLLRKRSRVQDAVQRHAASADAFITLAASGAAPLGLRHTGSRTFQVYGSWLGLPAFTLPILEEMGLPVGVQLLGTAGGDAGLCGIAGWLLSEAAG